MKKLCVLICFMIVLFSSCEEEYLPPVIAEEEIVVEGYIEGGENAMLPYVLLTRTSPFINRFDSAFFNNLFVHDAEVVIQIGDQRVVLNELCLNDLPADIRAEAALSFGLDTMDLRVNVCAYVDLANQLPIIEGGEYILEVEAEDKSIRATTTMPARVPLDSLRFVRLGGLVGETHVKMLGFIQDPADELNYYRYFVKEEGGPFVTGFATVTDDAFFNGLQFELEIRKPLPPNQSINLEYFGLYERGITYTVKWSTMDKAHFEFWNTLEFNQANEGPFSTYTRVASNIEGGLGIFGAYNQYQYEIRAPR